MLLSTVGKIIVQSFLFSIRILLDTIYSLWRKTVNKVSAVFNQGRKQSGPAPVILIAPFFLPDPTHRELVLVLFPCFYLA